MARKGCTTRKNRWEHREYLKELSNRLGHIQAQHPQVRRQIEDANEQVADVLERMIADAVVLPDDIEGDHGFYADGIEAMTVTLEGWREFKSQYKGVTGIDFYIRDGYFDEDGVFVITNARIDNVSLVPKEET